MQISPLLLPRNSILALIYDVEAVLAQYTHQLVNWSVRYEILASHSSSFNRVFGQRVMSRVDCIGIRGFTDYDWWKYELV